MLLLFIVCDDLLADTAANVSKYWGFSFLNSTCELAIRHGCKAWL